MPLIEVREPKEKLTTDIDNLQNSWLDTLEYLGVYFDDDQVVSITTRKYRGAANWLTKISVKTEVP